MQLNQAMLPPTFKGLLFRAGSLRFRFEGADAQGLARLVVDDAAGTGALNIPLTMRLVQADEAPRSIFNDSVHPTLVLYPGRRRHPLGHSAPTSWLNQAGDGLIAVIAKGVVLHAMIDGIVNPGIIPVREKTIGRPNASFLWIAVAAISLPINLTRRLLIDTVHFSGYTIEEWLKDAVQNDWLMASASLRDRRYTVSHNGMKSLAEFVEAKWIDWRSGKYPDRLGSPVRRYFAAQGQLEQYKKVAVNAKQPFIVSGLSVLEQRANLVASTSIRELSFITTKEAAGAMVTNGKMKMFETREVPGASEVTILDARHPIFGIYEKRQQASRDGWPLGLAALDCIDHPNPRIAMLAKDQWRKWIDEIQTANIEPFTPNDKGHQLNPGNDQ